MRRKRCAVSAALASGSRSRQVSVFGRLVWVASVRASQCQVRLLRLPWCLPVSIKCHAAALALSQTACAVQVAASVVRRRFGSAVSAAGTVARHRTPAFECKVLCFSSVPAACLVPEQRGSFGRVCARQSNFSLERTRAAFGSFALRACALRSAQALAATRNRLCQHPSGNPTLHQCETSTSNHSAPP